MLKKTVFAILLALSCFAAVGGAETLGPPTCIPCQWVN